MSDLISRQTAIDAVQGIGRLATLPDNDAVVRMSAVEYVLFNLPSAQQEEAIPAAWLEEQAKWFESMDNAFAKIEANNIRVMIKKWRSEKDERSD